MEKPVDSGTSRDLRRWIGFALLVILVSIAGWKLATTPWKIDLTGFSFTDLLSLLLALFAVLMSALFYFKANESSNAFYDNTYHFSKDMSEILARIESGFGERLKHLDDGYAGIANKVNGVGQIKAVKEDVKSGEDAVKKAEQEREHLLDELMKKARLQDDEKKELIRQMHEKDRQLDDEKTQLSFLQHRLTRAEHIEEIAPDISDTRFRPGFLEYAFEHIIGPISSDFILAANRADIERQFGVLVPDLAPEFVRDLRQQSWIDSSRQLTEKGHRWLHRLAAAKS
ncbi:MAG TPA: hypothetical protein VF370_06010 [Candidatus Cryosericum sp.]